VEAEEEAVVGFTYHEDGATVYETHYFVNGIELAVTHSLRLTDADLVYAVEIEGPDGTKEQRIYNFGLPDTLKP
jgi:hypothetical protein